MKMEDFISKSKEMGDFYVYYTTEERPNSFIVATQEYSPYIKDKDRKFKFNPKTEVKLFSFTQNRFVVLPVKSIKKLVPLATVLKNVR